jgi:hypothetical protein
MTETSSKSHGIGLKSGLAGAQWGFDGANIAT